MARTFRRNDVDAFAASRTSFSDRDNARAMRAAAFTEMGLDGDSVASVPLRGAKARREAMRLLNGHR